MSSGYLAGESVGPSPRGSGESQSAEELMLEAGLELVDLHGLGLTFDSISYSKVFKFLWNEYEVTVTRASVHERIWANQDDFRRDVLTESVAYFPMDSVSEAILHRAVSITSPNDFAKDLGSRTFPKVIQSQMSGRFQSVKALASWFDDPLAAETLHRLLNERAESALADARVEFPSTLARLGLRPKIELGLTIDQTADLCFGLIAALTEGGQLNYHAGSHDITAPIDFMSTPSTSDEPWRVLSIAIKCFLDFLYEPVSESVEAVDPAHTPRRHKVPKVEVDNYLTTPGSSRRPRSQLRELVLAAAVELLLQDGPQLRPQTLSYSSVFEHLKQSHGITVHRSSVQPRIWDNNDDFRNEVLAKSLVASAYPVPAVTRAVSAVRPVLRPDQSVDRRQSANEVFRKAGDSYSDVCAQSADSKRLLQIKAALIDQPDSEARTTLRAAVAAAERQRMDGNKVELQTLVLDLGFQVKPDIGLSEDEALELFEILSMTTATGVIFNELAGITSATRTSSFKHPDGDDRSEEWAPLGIALRSYFEQLYEPTP